MAEDKEEKREGSISPQEAQPKSIRELLTADTTGIPEEEAFKIAARVQSRLPHGTAHEQKLRLIKEALDEYRQSRKQKTRTVFTPKPPLPKIPTPTKSQPPPTAGSLTDFAKGLRIWKK